MKMEETAVELLNILIGYANFNEKNIEQKKLNSIHFNKITECVSKNKPIQFVLPAFPAKSKNHQKTHSHVPDLGEVESLRRINSMCKEIIRVYSPGAQIVICSDGRVFSDLVGVTEEDVTSYRLAIKEIAENFNLEYLTFFDLEDRYPKEFNFHEMRSALESEHASSIDDLKLRVKKDKNTGSLFNGIHRFIKEDYLVIKPDLSKNQINKVSKSVAYQVILRSNAWSSLVEQEFPNAVRLSIHPQALDSEKFPIQLLPCKENWGTPWHRVAVLVNGKLGLMRKLEVQKLGGTLKYFSEKYAYFEVVV